MNAKIADTLIHISLSKPKWVYAILLILALGVGSLISQIKVDTDPENMLPETHAARVFHNQTKQRFAMYDSIVVGVKNSQSIYQATSLSDVAQLTNSILDIEGVIAADVMSLSTVDNISQGANGTIQFDWMMKSAPQNDAEAKQIQQNIERLPLLYDTLVAQDGKAAAIYVPIADKNESYRIAQTIRGYVSQFDGLDTWYITGLPVAEDQFGVEMFVQMGISAPLAGLMIFILLFVFFRNIPLIVAPMIVAMATVIVTMGLLIGAGFTVHIMSSMIAIFLMPIAVVDSVHILSEFADRYKPGEDVKVVVKEVVSHLFTPMLYTSITSSVGFFSLMLTPIPPVQIFGGFVGFGILFAFLVTIVFIPAYVSRMTPTALEKLQAVMHSSHSNGHWVARVAKKIGKIATLKQTPLLLIFGGVFAVSIWGIAQIQINDNPVRWFKPDHEIRVADKVLNEHFAGTYNAYLVLTSTDELPSVYELFKQHSIPQTLLNWRDVQIKMSEIAQSKTEALQALVMAIDDKLFDDIGDDEVVFLETLLSHSEQELAQTKRFQDPQILNYLSQLQAYLVETGLVGKSNSLSDVVKVVNRELRSGDMSDYVLPSSAEGVAQTLLQYQSSHRPNDLWHFVTPDYRSTLLWLQLTSGDNQDMSAVINAVNRYFDQNPLPENVAADWAGKAYLNSVWQDNMVAGMIDSLISAFIIVFIMMVILFRSFVFGALAMLPLTLTISFIYGLIGIVGKDYDMPIAVLSSLTLGLSVDFAIHFIERVRAIYKETGDIHRTFDAMFGEPASAITRNALVIALGFTPLLFAPLVPYITVGVFLASIMAVSALVTLLALPAVMMKLQRIVFKNKG